MNEWYHYIPVKSGSSQEELKDILEFVKAFPDLSKEIAENGQHFIQEYLGMDDIECYWQKLIQEYTGLLEFVPVQNTTFLEIKA